MVKNVIKHGRLTAAIYWGGTIEFFDKIWNSRLRNSFSQDITAVTSVGEDLALGLADGGIYLLKVTVE